MMQVVLIVVKLLTLFISLLIAFYAYRAYRRYDSEPLLFLSCGFGLFGIGIFLEGTLIELGVLAVYEAMAVHATFMALGMLAVLYSLYTGTDLAET